jgi:hypothetical protein
MKYIGIKMFLGPETIRTGIEQLTLLKFYAGPMFSMSLNLRTSDRD